MDNKTPEADFSIHEQAQPIEASRDLGAELENESQFGEKIITFAQERDYEELTPYIDSSTFPAELILAVKKPSGRQVITAEDVENAKNATLALGVDAILQVSLDMPKANGIRDNLESLEYLDWVLRSAYTRGIDALNNDPDALAIVRSNAARVLGVDESRIPATKKELIEWFSGYSEYAISKIGRAFKLLESYTNRRY